MDDGQIGSATTTHYLRIAGDVKDIADVLFALFAFLLAEEWAIIDSSKGPFPLIDGGPKQGQPAEASMYRDKAAKLAWEEDGEWADRIHIKLDAEPDEDGCRVINLTAASESDANGLLAKFLTMLDEHVKQRREEAECDSPTSE